MFRSFRNRSRQVKPKTPSRRLLFVEELEPRCLLSNGGITVDPSGNLWITEPGSQIGQLDPTKGVIQNFSLPYGSAMLGEITSDANGNLWFSREDRIDELTPSTGAVREFLLPPGSGTGMGVNITAAPDGDIWFPFWNRQGPSLGQLDPRSGVIKEFALPANTSVNDIVAGRDGTVWFTESEVKKAIGRLDPQTGAIQEFPTSGARGPGAITVGPDGNLWFTDDNNIPSTIADRIGLIDATTGQIKEFDLPAGHRIFPSMTVGSDGNIWFLGYGPVNWIGDISPSTGSVKIFAFPGPWEPTGIMSGPEGNLWFPVATMQGSTRLGAISVFNPITGTFVQLFEPGVESGASPTGNPTASNNSISATGTTLSTTAGFDLVGAVASFTPQAPIASPGHAYQATVNWGDGTTSDIVLTVTTSGTYDVVASHAYQTAGTYSIKVTIGNFDPANPLGDNPITVFSTATVDPFNMNM